MNCHSCKGVETRVVDSRWMPPNKVRRRRECPLCMNRFTTYEQSAITYPKVVKRDGSLVPFDEGKIRKGVLKALEKRPMAHDICEKLMTRIVGDILHRSSREITTSQIGDDVMTCLLEMDHIAYIRFASVYKSFETIDYFHDFINELRPKIEELS